MVPQVQLQPLWVREVHADSLCLAIEGIIMALALKKKS